jgi:hypothetical protein
MCRFIKLLHKTKKFVNLFILIFFTGLTFILNNYFYDLKDIEEISLLFIYNFKFDSLFCVFDYNCIINIDNILQSSDIDLEEELSSYE